MKLNKLSLITFLMILLISPVSVAASNNTASNNNSHIQTNQAVGHDNNDEKLHVNLGEILPLWSCIPFACMLLSIAFLPLFADHLWHNNFGKISFFWAASLALPFLFVYKAEAAHQILHIILADYVPFIILLWTL